MNNRNYIEHDGTIVAQIAENKYLVKIVQQSACATCKAAALCTVAESKEKCIEAISGEKKFAIGEQVEIYGRTALGYKALILAIVIPLAIALTTLLLTTYYTANEAVAGISTLVILVPYYFLLWTMRNKIKQTFVFYIRPKI